MYAPTPSFRDRAGPLAAVLLIHVAIGYALLNLSGAGAAIAERADLAIFDVTLPPPPVVPPPPPPPPPAVEQRTQAKAKPKDEGAAAPVNIKSAATPVVAPKPRIILPAPTPIVAAIKPSTGANATQGAGDVVGPGTGAGGTGNGTGSGGAGNGGGGGGGQAEARARLVTPVLTLRDFSPSIYRQVPRGASVSIILRVGSDGVPLSCRVGRSFGNPPIDAEICRVAVERLRFEPGRDDRGRAVPDFVGYTQRF